MTLKDHKLHYEAMKYERWPSFKRVARVRAEQIIARADKLAERIPSWRVFKRLEKLESKLDKPFVHESGLKHYVDDAVEAAIKEFLKKKAVKR